MQASSRSKRDVNQQSSRTNEMKEFKFHHFGSFALRDDGGGVIFLATDVYMWDLGCGMWNILHIVFYIQLNE